jgi:hypothetical protein
MVKALSLEGKRFGSLIVIKRSGSIGSKAAWECLCDCGGESRTTSNNLVSGKTLSCGCLMRKTASKNAIKRNTIHGHNRSGTGNQTRTWNSWSSMLKRCRNPKNTNYPNYGGRGISVCDRWSEYVNFLADMGERPEGKTLDRINVNGNYEPSNCRWATLSEQQKNKRCHVDG